MSAKFQPINRNTPYLLPPSLQDWLPEKHLARFVVDIVDQLDLSGRNVLLLRSGQTRHTPRGVKGIKRYSSLSRELCIHINQIGKYRSHHLVYRLSPAHTEP